jgi:hypothetical protein
MTRREWEGMGIGQFPLKGKKDINNNTLLNNTIFVVVM